MVANDFIGRDIIKKIEEKRKSKVIVYFTGIDFLSQHASPRMRLDLYMTIY
jgi:hypothetical protein